VRARPEIVVWCRISRGPSGNDAEVAWDERARADFDAAYANLVTVTCHVAQRFFRYDPTGISDVVAETMARAYERWERAQRSPNPVAWVILCAKDVCLEQLRARAESHSDALDTARLATTICDTLDHMSRTQRDVAVLRFMMDCDEPTTAVALNLSPSKLDALAEKARRRMGRLLNGIYAQADEVVA
jgi:DNA-directed RNA polymerase specialized sigma24 family protein